MEYDGALSVNSSIRNSSPPPALKRKRYNQTLSVLTNGSEILDLTKDLEGKLRSTQRGMKKKMLCITWRQEVKIIYWGTIIGG